MWFNPNASVSRRPGEERLAFPRRLQDLVHAAVSLKSCKLRLGPIVSFLLTVWCAAEKVSKRAQKWRLESPIFTTYNYSLLTGNISFSFPAWSDRDIHVLKDVFDDMVSETLMTYALHITCVSSLYISPVKVLQGISSLK